tara:strand:- start:485 stop:868 length:384 start_codon:yes stop_codon:yes gene_type:complete
MNEAQFIYFSIISIGSILGANLRHLILTRLGSKKLNNRGRLLLINSIASMILGISISLNNYNNILYREFIILFLIGFAGSLSTFSTFIHDLFKLSIKRKYKDITIIIFSSVFLGLISILIGLFVGNF